MEAINKIETNGAKLPVIIVTYNGMRWIDRCLRSLRDSGTAVDVIVIDNGSVDGTQDRIRDAFPEVEMIQSEKNLGFGQANNIGLRLALERNAEHVFLLNQDAWVLPDTLGRLVAASGLHPEFGVLSPMHLNGPGDALELIFSRYIVPDKCPDLYSDITVGLVKDQPYPVEFVLAAAWLISRKCLMTVGGFSPSFFHYAEDDNYIHRVHHHKLMTGIVPTAWAHHDRAQRVPNPIFDDRMPGLRRRAALKYSDPATDAAPSAERLALRLTLVRGFLVGRRAGYHYARERLAILNSLPWASLLGNREASRAVGPTFL
jgi:GT2 family glycosyltransferase